MPKLYTSTIFLMKFIYIFVLYIYNTHKSNIQIQRRYSIHGVYNARSLSVHIYLLFYTTFRPRGLRSLTVVLSPKIFNSDHVKTRARLFAAPPIRFIRIRCITRSTRVRYTHAPRRQWTERELRYGNHSYITPSVDRTRVRLSPLENAVVILWKSYSFFSRYFTSFLPYIHTCIRWH